MCILGIPQNFVYRCDIQVNTVMFLVFIFLVEDGLGMNEICDVALLADEDERSLRWLLNTFKEQNPKSAQIRERKT